MTHQSSSPDTMQACTCQPRPMQLAHEPGCALFRSSAVSRDALVFKISAALADGKDSGGYDTLLDMYAHIALRVMETNSVAQPRQEPHETTYLRGWNEATERAAEIAGLNGWEATAAQIRDLAVPSTYRQLQPGDAGYDAGPESSTLSSPQGDTQ